MFSLTDTLMKADPVLWQAIELENRRQESHIELIASENYVSRPVMQALGSQLTNKYAEGIRPSVTTAVASTSTKSSN